MGNSLSENRYENQTYEENTKQRLSDLKETIGNPPWDKVKKIIQDKLDDKKIIFSESNRTGISRIYDKVISTCTIDAFYKYIDIIVNRKRKETERDLHFSFTLDFVSIKAGDKVNTLKDYIDLIRLNDDVRFHDINIFLRKNTKIPIEKIKDLIKIQPDINIPTIQNCMTRRNNELNIDDVIYILQQNPKVDFNGLASIKKQVPDISLEEIKEISKIYPQANFDIQDTKNMSKQEIIEKIKIGHNKEEYEYDKKTWKSLCDYLEKEPKHIKIGNKKVPLGHQNLMSGLYNTQIQMEKTKKLKYKDQAIGVSWDQALEEYQDNIDDFLRSTTEAIDPETQKVLNTDVLFGHVTKEQETKKDPTKNAFQIYRQPLLDHYTNRYTTITDIAQQGKTPTETIGIIHDRLKNTNNTNRKLIFELGAHGNVDGSAEFGDDIRTKANFEELFAIVDPRLTVAISSCFSNAKIETKNTQPKNKILYSGSGNQEGNVFSTKIFLDAYIQKTNIFDKKGDRNEDGDVSWAEAKVYEMIYYSDSITPFFWQKDKINRVRLALQENQIVTDQT